MILTCLAGQDTNPYPLANLGILSGSSSFTDLRLPNPSSTTMKHQQSYSSLSSGGGTPIQTVPSYSTIETMSTPQAPAPGKSRSHDGSKSSQGGHHHHSIFHRHQSPSQSHTQPPRSKTIDNSEIILDTDLRKLQGIVSNKVPQAVYEAQRKRSMEVNPVAPWETSPRYSSILPSTTAQNNDATWTAPESWGVRPHNAITEDLPDFPDEIDGKDLKKQMYCLRVFRTDSTFATMNCAANTSVQELLGMLAKKFFVAVGERWVLVHYHNNLARVMQPTERPVTLQQKSLERLGYVEEADGGGEMGRDDWSGFWRFVFMRVDELSTLTVRLPYLYPTNASRTKFISIKSRM
jgi:adenylate cyclase